MKARSGFAGFPAGKAASTPLPNLFFSDLLPAIDDLGELKVTLYAFWALGRQRGPRRCLRLADLRQDKLLLNALAAKGLPAQAALDEALERAVARGTLLKVAAQGRAEAAYFLLNSPRGRAAAEELVQGTWSPDPGQGQARLQAERPNIYVLYEQNLGALTPLLAETLHEAAATYPASWIEDAIRLAVENNVRRWRYVQAILEDWRTKGRDEREDQRDPEAARRRYVEGDFADFVEH
jgi:DnaD/phage-associated family protein